MSQILGSESACPGDGNEDKIVNGQDLQFWRKFAALAMGGSSWYDFDLDEVSLCGQVRPRQSRPEQMRLLGGTLIIRT